MFILKHICFFYCECVFFIMSNISFKRVHLFFYEGALNKNKNTFLFNGGQYFICWAILFLYCIFLTTFTNYIFLII